jgi:outer membrane protein assembly factor BamA
LLFSQVPLPEKIVINQIRIEGNKHTRNYIILRELDIHICDTIPRQKIDSLLKTNENRINNTQLFNSVKIQLSLRDSLQSELLILVTERWYIFPNIIFEIADRNFNEWWYIRGRDLSRTNYGGRFTHKNMFGRAEVLRTNIQFGFTKRFEVSYDIPYMDKSLKNGLGFSMSYAENKEVAFRSGTIRYIDEDKKIVKDTLFNRLEYYKSDNLMRSRFNASVNFNRRSRFYTFHSAELGYNYNTISNEVANVNPDYYGNDQTLQHYAYLTYNFTFDKRDNVVYPLKGKFLSVDLQKSGLLPTDNINQFSISTKFASYYTLGKKYYFSIGLQAKTTFPKNPPYNNYRALGYGQTLVRGYDLYVIDGNYFGLSKFTFKKEIFRVQKSFPKLMPLKQFQTVPLDFYLKTYFDAAYVRDLSHNIFNSRFSNKLIYGAGVGMDIVTFYSLVMGFDLTRTREGEIRFLARFVKDI